MLTYWERRYYAPKEDDQSVVKITWIYIKVLTKWLTEIPFGEVNKNSKGINIEFFCSNKSLSNPSR